MTPFAEAEVEQAALDWPEGLGWQFAHAQDVAAGGATAGAGVGGCTSRDRTTHLVTKRCKWTS